MAFIITSDQEVPVSVEFTDDHGNPATVSAPPVWASSDDTILSVLAADDGMSAVIAAVGPDGQAQVSVTADGILGVIDIQVVSGSAAFAVVTPGTPVPHTP
jgi:hypothetical protein